MPYVCQMFAKPMYQVAHGLEVYRRCLRKYHWAWELSNVRGSFEFAVQVSWRCALCGLWSCVKDSISEPGNATHVHYLCASCNNFIANIHLAGTWNSFRLNFHNWRQILIVFICVVWKWSIQLTISFWNSHFHFRKSLNSSTNIPTFQYSSFD